MLKNIILFIVMLVLYACVTGREYAKREPREPREPRVFGAADRF